MSTFAITAKDTEKRNGISSRAAQTGRFLLHLLEMQVPMGLGMWIFALLVRPLRATTYGAAFQSGADLYILGDGLFMSLPMVAWMIFRGHGWRHSIEMGASMLAPGIAIIVLGWLGADAYVPWLAKASCGVMCLGMIIYMVYRRDHFTGKGTHSAHNGHAEASVEAACHTG